MCDQNYQQYWFNVPSDPILPDVTDNSNLTLVGINNSNPQYTLDVGGNTRTSNLIVNGLIQSSNLLNTAAIESTYVDASYITASNVVASNMETNQLHFYSSNYSPSNFSLSNFHDMMWMNGYNMSEAFPNTGGTLDVDWWFNVERQNAPIHPSWIIDDQNILSDLWELAETGVDIAEAIAEVAGFFDPAQSIIPQAVLDALDKALSAGDESLSNSNSNVAYVSWSNLKSKPLAISGLDLGVKGDIYIDESKSIKTVNSSYLTKSGRDNLNFISKSNAETVINLGTREFFPNKVSLGSNLYIDSNLIRFGGSNSNAVITQDTIKLGSNISFNASNTDFKIQNWNYTSNTVSCSNTNTYWKNRIYFSSNVSAPAVNANQLFSDSNGFLWWQSSNVQLKFQDTSSAIPEQYTSSYLTQTASVLNYKTKDSTFNYGSSNAPQVTQMSIDSNGCLYVASNILMNNEVRLRCASNDFYGVYQEGQIRLEANALRLYNTSNYNNSNYERMIASVNSNGLFLIDRSSVLGKTEYITDPFLGTTYSNFPRLDITLENGLIFGSGISSNQWLANPNIDFFKLTRNSELLSWASDCNQHYMTINSNAEIVKGTLKIDKWGGIKTAGCNFMLSNGTLQRGVMNYYTSGNIENTSKSNLLYTSSNDTLSCSKIGIGISTPMKDFQIQSASNECGMRIQSGTAGNQCHLYMTAKDGVQSSISYYNKPLKIGRVTDGNDVSGTTQNTMVFAVNDNIGINKLTPSYNLDIAGSFNACNIYENGTLLTSKYSSQSNYSSLSNYTYNLTLSNSFTTCNIYTSNITSGEANIAGTILGASGLAFAGAAGAYLLNQNGQLSSVLQDSLTTGSKITIDPTTGLCYATFGNFVNGAKFGPASIYLSNNQVIFTSNTTSNMVLGSNSLTMYNNQPFTISNANLNVTNCNILEGNVLLSSKYAPSNTLSNYVLTSTGNTQYAPSNTLSNYVLTSTGNTQYAPSNTLSNYVLTSTGNTQYAPSNTLSNYVLTSTANTQYAPSNTLSNYILTTTGSTTYAASNTLSNYGLKTQTDYTSNSLSNVLRNPTSSTIVNNASPSGVYNGLLVNNSNINYGSGAGVVLQTGGNWSAKVYEDCQGTGNHFKVDLTHGNTAYSNALDLVNNSGAVTGTIGNLAVGDYGYGSTDWYGISHCNVASQAGKYALLQSSSGQTLINTASNTTLELRSDNTLIAQFTSLYGWGIGASISGTYGYLNQGCGAMMKASQWKVMTGSGTYTADIRVYTDLFPYSNYYHNCWCGDLSVYISGGQNGVNGGVARLYITNIYPNNLQCYTKSIDNRGCTITVVGVVSSTTIRVQCDTFSAYAFKFEGAV
jgi:hypothetical protein